jgi:hypothetical protein
VRKLQAIAVLFIVLVVMTAAADAQVPAYAGPYPAPVYTAPAYAYPAPTYYTPAPVYPAPAYAGPSVYVSPYLYGGWGYPSRAYVHWGPHHAYYRYRW